MPTSDRLEAASIELAEKLERLGNEVQDPRGPIQEQSDDGSEYERWHILAEAHEGKFYIRLYEDWDFGQIVYPYRISSHIGRQLEVDEIEAITGNDFDIDDSDESEIEPERREAGAEIIDNTEYSDVWLARFQLKAYSMSAHAGLHMSPEDAVFPKMIRTVRKVFPYSENQSLRDLNDRVESVLFAGTLGSEYIESSIYVDKESSPEDFHLSYRF